MDPNQQQPQNPQPVPQQPAYTPPQPAQPLPQSPQPTYPQSPSNYPQSAAPTSYDPNYLDSIAPPPPRPSFFSGSFGKIFFLLIGLFVIAVSIIVASSGRDETADLQQIAVRLENFAPVAKTVQSQLKSSNLVTTNSNYQIWLSGNRGSAEDLLKQGGVEKTDYNKQMVAKEKTIATDLGTKFEDARLSARLDRVYATTMSAETDKLINLLNTMSRKSKSAKIRDFAKEASTNLQPLQKSFADYVDDGN